MSAGQRFKVKGSRVAILTAYAANSPAGVVTGITQASPAVVTDAGHNMNDGDVIKLADIVGMEELNGQVAVVNVLTSNTFELLGVDSTGYGAYTSGGTYTKGTFSNHCEVTDYNRAGGSSAEIPATTFCSDAIETEQGLPDYGTTTLSFNFAPVTSDVQAAVAAYDLSKDTMAVRLTLPNSGGFMVQLGQVQSTSESGGVNGIYTGSVSIRNTGARRDFAGTPSA